MSRYSLPLACLAAALLPQISRADEPTGVRWTTTQLDKAFRSEGVAVGDVNKDGKKDVLVGDLWYEAPDWKPHVIREDRKFDPLKYSQSFVVAADDINKDGWVDQLVIGMPGEPCYWYENPGDKGGKWKEHEIWHSACNETPQYVDLFGTGRRVLLMGWQPKGEMRLGQMAWFAPGDDPTKTWVMHPISVPSTKEKEIPGTFRYSHGLGFGDVNGDGRNDVLCTGGWWEQPGKLTDSPWTFQAADLGPDCAHMHVQDMDNDGKNDVVASSAHRYGIWWHRQLGKTGFARHDLFPMLFSQTHALHLVDIDGDGLKDLVTGRRWWAHGPKGDIDADRPAVLYWFKAIRGKDGTIRFEPHQIHDDSGVGTQFEVIDIDGDGLLDIVVSNKKGVFVTRQLREPAAVGRTPARRD